MAALASFASSFWTLLYFPSTCRRAAPHAGHYDDDIAPATPRITRAHTHVRGSGAHPPAAVGEVEAFAYARVRTLDRTPGLRRLSTLKLLPLRVLSRMYGAVNKVPLPLATRSLIYKSWAFLFRARLDEVARPLHEYPHLTAFFTRRLRDGVRIIDADAPIVSPCDGAVVSLSHNVEQGGGVVTQVKGIDYRLADFLGMEPPKLRPGNSMFAAVLYLSPGDYHRFHSPTDWLARSRIHIAGQLLPVNPIMARVLPSLFCSNERVAVLGEWEHGFMSYTAVGATNVGSIKLDFDPTVITNTYRQDWDCGFAPLDALGLSSRPGDVHRPRLVDSREYEEPIRLARGDDMGLFELGSTIVLVFEAPEDFTFDIKVGDKVRVGAPIAHLSKASPLGMPTAEQTAAAAAAVQNAIERCDIDTDALPMLRLLAGAGHEGVSIRPMGRGRARTRAYSADDYLSLRKLHSAGFTAPFMAEAGRAPTSPSTLGFGGEVSDDDAVGAVDDDFRSCVSSSDDDDDFAGAVCKPSAEMSVEGALKDLHRIYDALAAALL